MIICVTCKRRREPLETMFVVNFILLWLVVLFNLLLTLALIHRGDASSQSIQKTGLKAGEIAPDFTAQSLTGETVHLSTYLGCKVAFFFISTTCTPYRKVMPDLLALAPKATQASVELVLVSSSEVQETRSFVEEFDIHTPVLVAPRLQSSFFSDYRAVGVPSYCVVNERGMVQASGFLADNMWKMFVESWVHDQEVFSSQEILLSSNH